MLDRVNIGIDGFIYKYNNYIYIKLIIFVYTNMLYTIILGCLCIKDDYKNSFLDFYVYIHPNFIR